MSTDQRCRACGSMLAEDCGDCPMCAVFGPPVETRAVPHCCPRCHVVKDEGAPCRVCWQQTSDPMADLAAACDRAREESARGPQPSVITDRQVETLRKIDAMLGLDERQRAFAEAVAKRLQPGWSLVLDPVFEPDALVFFQHYPDRIFAGQKAFDAVAPRVAELGGKVAT